MIGRLWHGWTRRADADAYETLLRQEILPGIHRVSGYRGAYLFRRDAGEEAEFVTLTFFDSLEAVRAFAGEDYERAVVPPAARRLLTRFDARSTHYRTVVGPGGEAGGSARLPRRLPGRAAPARSVLADLPPARDRAGGDRSRRHRGHAAFLRPLSLVAQPGDGPGLERAGGARLPGGARRSHRGRGRVPGGPESLGPRRAHPPPRPAALYGAGVGLYGAATRPRDRTGRLGLAGLVAVLYVLYVVNPIGPPPPDARSLAVVALGVCLFPLWGWWIDRHREIRPRP